MPSWSCLTSCAASSLHACQGAPSIQDCSLLDWLSEQSIASICGSYACAPAWLPCSISSALPPSAAVLLPVPWKGSRASALRGCRSLHGVPFGETSGFMPGALLSAALLLLVAAADVLLRGGGASERHCACVSCCCMERHAGSCPSGSDPHVADASQAVQDSEFNGEHGRPCKRP